MDDVPRCLRLPKPWMEKALVEEGLRSGLPLFIRYDPNRGSAWGARVYYSLYELKVDERMLISYDEMKDDLRSSRHFSEWAAGVLVLAAMGSAFMAARSARRKASSD